METFSSRLAESIKRSGLSRPEFAAKAGVGTSALTKWLTGKLTPKSEQLHSLAQTAGVSMEWLLTGFDLPLKDRFLAEPDWVKRGDLVKKSGFVDMMRLLGYDSRGLWKEPQIGSLGALLELYSTAVRGLLETIADEEMFGLDDKLVRTRKDFYATASSLQPLFDSWLASLKKPAAAPTTENEPPAE